MSQKTLFTKSALAVAVALISTQAWSAGFQLNEFSSSGLGRAYSGEGAIADDAGNASRNPALIMMFDRPTFSAGAVYIDPDVNISGKSPYTGRSTDADNIAPTAWVPNAHFVMPINEQFGWGASVTSNYGLATEFNNNYPAGEYGGKTDLTTLNLNLSGAYRLNDNWSFGLGFDADDAQLAQGLRATRGGRGERAQEISEQLAAAGIAGAYEGALRYVGNPELISRTHFARYLVEIGVCHDTPEVFRRFLTEGRPGYVPHRWAALGDAVRWIREAGGLAVIAHPARYGFSPNEEYALFTEFKHHGGQGVEVVTGSHTSAEYLTYAAMAKEFGLAASRGSDFHSPEESRTDLGALPPLPSNLQPVWELLASRIQPAPGLPA